MFNSPVLDVLVGMIFVFSLFSILVTQINSFLGNILLLRARHLRGAIDEMITDEQIRAKVLVHPLISFLKDKSILPQDIDSEETARAVLNSAIENVTWIEPATFAKVVLDTIGFNCELFMPVLEVIYNMPPGTARTRVQAQLNEVLTTGKGLNDLRMTVRGVKDDDYRTALEEAIARIYEELNECDLDPEALVPVMAGLEGLDPKFKGSISTLLSGINSIDAAQYRIAEWFDDAMVRTTNFFKRTMEYYSVVAGLVIAVVLNVDALFIAQTLWNDPAMREAVVTAAQIAAVEAEAGAPAAPEVNEEDPVQGATDALLAAEETLDDILALRLPMGWSWQNPATRETEQLRVAPQRNGYCLLTGGCDRSWFALVLAKILGLAATGIAVAQGAPFWFGLLGRVSSPRSSET